MTLLPRTGRRRLLAPLAIAGCALVAALLALLVEGGYTQEFDESVVRGLRRPDDPAIPKGPARLRELALDLTALGSVAVVLLVASTAVGFLLARRDHRAVVIAAATGGGLLLNTLLKHWVDRPRPDVVPHLREVTTPSFPSGHAAFSATVYLTLGLLLARSLPGGRAASVYCVAAAALYSLLAGLSRVYLGVHYPSDVAAGWCVGSAWALSCYAAWDLLRRRHGSVSPQGPARFNGPVTRRAGER